MNSRGNAVEFISTRNKDNKVSFSQAILDCLPRDGGLYVPAYEEDLRQWILYMDENTSFPSIAGALTSALIKNEFSPIISEAIATKAFPFNPELRQLSNNLYLLELFHGPTGSYKDFGISYMASCLEHILLMGDKQSTILAVTAGKTGASIAKAIRDKKRLKAVLLYPEGTMRALDESDFIWNGGNIFPVEVAGTKDDCHKLAGEIFKNHDLVKRYGLTLANSANIARLISQAFLFIYAFTRLKKKVFGDIFYALSAGNYGTLTAGLYSWKFSLPVNGFITQSTNRLVASLNGKCSIPDAIVPLEKRTVADPADPSHLERLEEVFIENPAVLNGMIFPAKVETADYEQAMKDMFVKHKIFVDDQTAIAYSAMQKRQNFIDEDSGSVVLFSRTHPVYSKEKIKFICGEEPETPPHLEFLFKKNKPERKIDLNIDSLINILNEIS
ncbi:MAG: pyridoxal-phosphate dependent enzyme [Treponemataceae bacterium]